jgi:hypothetical protein
MRGAAERARMMFTLETPAGFEKSFVQRECLRDFVEVPEARDGILFVRIYGIGSEPAAAIEGFGE